jgi:hypothetical protein
VAGEAGDGGEVLVLAVAADRVGAVPRDPRPERLRDGAVARLAGRLAVEGGADRLRDLRVRVEPVERVLAPGERIEDRPVVEEAREAQVLGVAGRPVERGERRPTQAATSFAPSRAAASPVAAWTSRRPARSLCSV